MVDKKQTIPKKMMEVFQFSNCPFCGCPILADRIVKGPGDLYDVTCGHCGASGPLSLSKKQAVKNWNTRVIIS
jgi:Lar family restriction alleviation protein